MFNLGGAKGRAHDRWAKHPSNKSRLDDMFKVMYEEKVKELGEDVAKKDKLKYQQIFRREEFAKLEKVDRDPWYEADDNEEEFNQAEWVETGLATILMFIDWFAEKSGCPVVFAAGAKAVLDADMAVVHT